MKKRIAMIAAALVLTFAGISASGLTVSVARADSGQSNRVDEQHVVEEDGKTVVYFITYTEPDNASLGQKVTWYDANGTKYVHIYKVKPEEEKKSQQDSFVISSTVTWQDAAGNTYVQDGNTQIVTVYDVNGSVIAVMQAK